MLVRERKAGSESENVRVRGRKRECTCASFGVCHTSSFRIGGLESSGLVQETILLLPAIHRLTASQSRDWGLTYFSRLKVTVGNNG